MAYHSVKMGTIGEQIVSLPVVPSFPVSPLVAQQPPLLGTGASFSFDTSNVADQIVGFMWPPIERRMNDFIPQAVDMAVAELQPRLPAIVDQMMPTIEARIPGVVERALPNVMNRAIPMIEQRIPALLDKAMPEVEKRIPGLINKAIPAVEKQIPTLINKALPSMAAVKKAAPYALFGGVAVLGLVTLAAVVTLKHAKKR